MAFFFYQDVKKTTRNLVDRVRGAEQRLEIYIVSLQNATDHLLTYSQKESASLSKRILALESDISVLKKKKVSIEYDEQSYNNHLMSIFLAEYQNFGQ